jgi:Hint domain
MPMMRRFAVLMAVATLVVGCTAGGASQAPSIGAPSSPPASVAASATATLAPVSSAAVSSAPVTLVPSSTAASTAGSGNASPAATIAVVSAATPAPTPARTPQPTVAPLAAAALRYDLVDQLGRPLFCDPDFYPVARADEALLAQQRLPAIRADGPTYRAITAHLGIDPAATPSADQVLAIYRAWKMLRALVLQPTGSGYAFDYVAASNAGAPAGWHVAGTIDAKGTITVARRDPSGPPPCPICLARGTRIATPDGSLAVEDLRAGMSVWTADSAGTPIVGLVLLVASSPVPPTHQVVDLRLADGRALRASPGHPLPDGRRLGDLQTGDLVDGSRVVSATLVPYAGGATFDLLPSGPTGTYWADGILLASTLQAPH